MLALILCAGYSTRLYPLTKNFPKPLLEIANRPVINYILEKLENLNEIETVYVVTNAKFYSHFLSWKNNLKTRLKIEILNDNTLTEEDKLGAIGDINFVINEKNIKEDLLIVAGDNLFDFEISEMFSYFKKNNIDIISLFEKEDIEELKKGSCVIIDKNNKVTFMEEKPQNPRSKLHGNCLYILTKSTIPLFHTYLSQNNNPDQPGRFIQWLYQKKEIHGFINKGKMFDIGTHKTLAKARKEFTSS